MTAADLGDLPLTGFTVGITAARRREELATLLERRGARVVHGPAIRILPLEDDRELLTATRACVDRPLDLVVATTAIGFRGWLEAADGWGVGDALRARLSAARLVARGPKARGALRAAGLAEEWSPGSESMSEVYDHLFAQELRGLRVAVQLHGEPLPDFVDALRAAGAEVVPVPVYRWMPPADLAPLRRLVDLVVARQLDAITFTSAPAVVSLLASAADQGVQEELLDALRTEVVPFCVGPVCAAPLERRGVPTPIPDRARLGNLVRAVAEQLPARQTSSLAVTGGRLLELRGSTAVLDGRAVALPPVPATLLRRLIRAQGGVLSRPELASDLRTASGDGHAVEVAVARLRALLGEPGLVETVTKRGYRLATEPAGVLLTGR